MKLLPDTTEKKNLGGNFGNSFHRTYTIEMESQYIKYTTV